jgi:CBS domain-containing protein
MKLIRAVIEGQQTRVVDQGASALEAARVMTEHGIGAVPVIDGERVAGIFTERDLMARVVAAGRDPASTSVRDVMSTELVVADAQETHAVGLRRMQQARVRHLMVLDRGRLAGVLSVRDLLAVEMNEKDEEINLLNAYVHFIPADLGGSQTKI